MTNREQTVDEMAREVYLQFADQFEIYVTENPTCEICKSAPSLRITRWGKIQAACVNCLTDEERQFYEFCQKCDEEESE